MESKIELKEIDVKICTCYYFGDIIKDLDIDFDNILLDKSYIQKNTKIFQFITFHAKL